ncbi:MAG: SDR family oxidoreductase [Rhodospirillales bacterium]|nr:SDR family oxidoreductase [Rhodospirillales bacterium]MDE2198363.1 SDR family oxidoreductase [Rhodospirillales bacterium]
MRLNGKAAIVTGGGSGIGQGIALAYAREGADVVVADINLAGAQSTAAEISRAGRKGIAIRTDVSDPDAVQALADEAVAALGRIDVLVNVAGITIPLPILDTTPEHWDRVLDVNLKGTFLCLQAAARQMAVQGGGAIINTTSVLGLHARRSRGAYCASKAGIIMLTRTAALEFGSLGIRVNAIAPGSIETPLMNSAPASREELARKAAAIPLKRRGTAADLTGPAIFLASDDALYVTGEVVVVDGGMTAGIE